MATAAENLELRVNGVVPTGLRVQRRMEDGYPSGPWDVLVEIPNLGYIELDEKPDFIIEMKESSRKRKWKRVTLPELVAWLQSHGVIRE